MFCEKGDDYINKIPVFIKGIISGGIATLMGFILSMIWDTYKYKRDKKNQEQIIISAIKKELEHNISILIHNQNILAKELKYVDENKSIITALSRLNDGFWDLAKLYLPEKLNNPDSLSKVDKVCKLTNITNEQIRNRENFKINNLALKDYSKELKMYDNLIDRLLYELTCETEELLEIINEEDK
jgi:hypothetical protein